MGVREAQRWQAPPHLLALKCHQKDVLRVSRMDSWMKVVSARYITATVCSSGGSGQRVEVEVGEG